MIQQPQPIGFPTYTTSGLGQPYTTVQTAGYTVVQDSAYTGMTYTTKPATTERLTPRKSAASHLTAQEALTKAHSMHIEVQELETTITVQQDEIAWLKEKLLHHKRKTLEKYFMWDEDFAKQASFHEWKHFMHKQKKLREIDGIHSAREQDRAEMMRKMHELQAQLVEMENAYQQLAAQEAQTREKLGKAEQLIRTVAGATTEYDMDTPAKSPSAIEGEAGYVKAKLHSLLQEVDPQYISPLKVLNVNDMTLGATVVEGATTTGNCTVGVASGVFRPPAVAQRPSIVTTTNLINSGARVLR